jgi:alpha-tubulin suppressor-like RCC1 family protein
VFCGQTESKAIWCWNNGNERWNFNNGSSFPAPLPFASIALTAVALGSNHACGMTATGDVYCWGNNSTGQLGAIEPRGQVTSPIKVPLPGTARGVTVAETGSASHSCAVLQSGQMYCWGSDNASGELGRGESSSSLNPIALASDPGFSDMQTQGMHSCGIKASNSRVYCWGNGSGFELGDGVGGSSSAPVEVLGGLTVTQLSVARHSTCVRTASAQAWCWPNQFGGYNLPTRFPIADPIAMISAGGTGSCALTSAGKIYCWGANDFGQLGNGQVNPCCSPTGPVLIQSSLTFAAIFAGAGPGGGSHACALTADGSAYCWGRNESGELGDGTQTNRSVPTAVIGGLKFTSLSTDFGGTCGVTVAKMVYCWGYQPWNRFTSASNVPQLYGPLKYNNFSLSYQNTCGIAEDGTAWCQGANEFGQVGVGSASMVVNNPVQVQSALRFAKIEPGIGFTCGLTSESKTYCWGGNRNYALGRAVAVLEAVSGGTVYKGSR